MILNNLKSTAVCKNSNDSNKQRFFFLNFAFRVTANFYRLTLLTRYEIRNSEIKKNSDVDTITFQQKKNKLLLKSLPRAG